MGIAQRARDSIRNIWSHGEHGDEEFDRGQDEPSEADAYPPEPRYEAAPVGRSNGGSGSGSHSGSHVRRVSAPVPLRSSRQDKQIYTIKPHGLEEASAAADFLKTGSAVVVNLDDVDRVTAVRIIDFMSGVCYGLDAQGHAMKLGDTIFLFTPGDFEITSDEPDYNENHEFFFRDVPTTSPATSAIEPASSVASPSSGAESSIIERTVMRPGAAAERMTIERPSVERPAAQSRPWER